MPNMNERFTEAYKRCQALLWTAENLYYIGLSTKVWELIQRYDRGERTEKLLQEMENVGHE